MRAARRPGLGAGAMILRFDARRPRATTKQPPAGGALKVSPEVHAIAMKLAELDRVSPGHVRAIHLLLDHILKNITRGSSKGWPS